MSFDLAIWEGERPAGDPAAGLAFDEMIQRYDEEEAEAPPTERIIAYVEALSRRWPDEDTGPWSVTPEPAGPFLYLCVVWSMAGEVAAYAAELARSMGLICYDPQSETLLT
ncbi:hypothetical protein I6A60_11285 [Frankia sp. AgB1.9]|uniref:hypothetical protein n=1 Tax=unclassified Frankia TaxID=2632575 RepID=UPI0019343C1E|nr:MULTISPECIES: hypothetical protein [unclassified Frankia]MBL7489695.1 hypothetical protein [Frankia sp. AgW1.1]MBL7548453.1 hypothetical protein [Frankia sp. AgB1.9]MBL7621343.1 hypothetical protein [Frankia sp. AgB1.8]